MPEYRFLAVDLLTHALLAELPLSAVKWGQRLNRAGALTAKLQLPAGTDGATIAAIYVDATDPLRRAVYVERDGVLTWGGPWVQRDYDPNTGELTLSGLEWWSLFSRRLITDTKTYVAGVDDQFSIVRDFFTYTQAKPGGDLGITLGAETSGVTRDRTYWYYELKSIQDAVQEMAADINGFDFAIEVGYDSGGNITRTLRLYYPRRGRIAGATGHVWEWGRNIIGFGWPEDGSIAANMIFGIGAGEATAMIRTSSSRPEQFSAGYPLLEATLVDKSLSVATTLADRVNLMLNDRQVPVVLPPVKVLGDLDPQVGAFITGDEGRIRFEPGDDPRFPEGIDTYRRIVGFDVEVSDTGGGETVTLTTDQAVAA